MRNFCLILISIIIVPSIWFSSCAKSETYDTDDKPVVSDVRFNFNDSLMYADGTLIKLNDSANTNPDRIDTLILGKMVYLTARFQDNVGLSSYRVKLVIDSSRLTPTNDSLLSFYSLGADIYSSNKHKIYDTVIQKNTLITIPTYALRTNKETQLKDTVAIYQGDYIMQIACGNIAGNRDSTSFSYRVKLLTRDSIYTIRKK
ncbi:hypothetical protein D0T84_14295 [Dysgonomonas sp. 521]|uniref:hypothetical protein n=1 Tax=Dysgonomonas sp. 521 TaxID=2302932 RepID=UPI0013D06648|nr:hypothetical protein [Dysgonomonas sp. 521]NDV96074.1 hypothetical protein [Dysgonomonas sp. 521]